MMPTVTLTLIQIYALVSLLNLLEKAAPGQRAKAMIRIAKGRLQGEEIPPEVERIYRTRLIDSPNFLSTGLLIEVVNGSNWPIRLTIPNGHAFPIVFSVTPDEFLELHPLLIATLKRDPLARKDLIDELSKRFMVMLREASPVTTGR
ncbi:hypothetical protein [Aeromonas hydrophila]|uniref:hypothetical protein n=1 Tax=Aeromonas hydrophila TaxID=644 RepID=UPI003EC73D08